MAASKTAKARLLAIDTMQACDQLMGALERLVAIKAEKESSAVDFAAADIVAQLESEDQTKHLTANVLNSVIGNATVIYNAMVAGGTLSAFTDDAFQEARP